MLTIISDVDNDGFGKGEGLKKPSSNMFGGEVSISVNYRPFCFLCVSGLFSVPMYITYS